MDLQLPLFPHTPGPGLSRLPEVVTQPAKDPLVDHGQLVPLVQTDGDWEDVKNEDTGALDPFEVLGLNPLLADVSADATGLLAEPDWSAVFATQNLLDHLAFGIADQPQAYEQRLYDAIWQAKHELTLVGHPQRVVPFYYHTERAHLRLALVIRDEFQPPAAVLGLAEDF